MRKALIVGIGHYESSSFPYLHGAVKDAHEVGALLERNADGTLNFPTPQLLIATSPGDLVTRNGLKKAVEELFTDDSEIALFYFSGHGHVENTGGYLCTSDSDSGDDGLALADVMTMANASPAKNKVIILDSCHGGSAGGRPLTPYSEIADGVTILTASTGNQAAFESDGGGVFTNLLLDALSGAAANLVGAITPGSVYAHIDQSLGPWGGQRPVFKTNVKSFISLREATPPIERGELQKLTTLFPTPDIRLDLDPSYEPQRSGVEGPDTPAPDPVNTASFASLQNLVKVNLVRPDGAPHMWHAAMKREGCKLTVLGQHYWQLVKDGLI